MWPWWSSGVPTPNGVDQISYRKVKGKISECGYASAKRVNIPTGDYGKDHARKKHYNYPAWKTSQALQEHVS
jgi:hypothetical protein